MQRSQLAGQFSPGYCHLFIAVAPVVSLLYVILHLVMNGASYQLLNILRTRPWATVHLIKKKKIGSDSKPRAWAAPRLSCGFRFCRCDCSSRLFCNTGICMTFTGAMQWFVHCFKWNSVYKLHFFILSGDIFKIFNNCQNSRKSIKWCLPLRGWFLLAVCYLLVLMKMFCSRLTVQRTTDISVQRTTD